MIFIIIIILIIFMVSTTSSVFDSKENKIEPINPDRNSIIPYSKYAQTNIDIEILLKNNKIINKKIGEIVLNHSKLCDNNELLKNDINTNEMIIRNNNVLSYLNLLFDKYVAISIELYFSGLVYYILKEDIKSINIKNKIDELYVDVNNYIKKYFPKAKSNEEIISLFNISGETILRILDDINTIKIKLINMQNRIIISGISPIQIESEFNSLLSSQYYSKLSTNIDELNTEYDRFLSEYEVTNDLNNIV